MDDQGGNQGDDQGNATLDVEKKSSEQMDDQGDNKGDDQDNDQGNATSDVEKKSSDVPKEPPSQDDQDNPEANKREVIESDQNSSQSNQEGIEPNQNGQGENDQEIVDGQMETTLKQDDQGENTENSNSDKDKTKTDQDVQSSTPPHTKDTSANSQATEIIDSYGSHNSQDSKGDDEYHIADQDSDSDKALSREDEESQYDRPWYKFWGSSDPPVSSNRTMHAHLNDTV